MSTKNVVAKSGRAAAKVFKSKFPGLVIKSYHVVKGKKKKSGDNSYTVNYVARKKKK